MEPDTTNEPASTLSADPNESAAPIDFISRASLDFPVVGVGASAGGLQALQYFFSATSPTSGMAYVVIQHLPPDHDSLLAEIIGRCTSMPVRQIEEGIPVERDHVYVIRPGRTVTLEQGRLHMGEPVEKRGHQRPVDDFFRSLAREQKERAIAIVLSGMGTNGTAGAQAIKAAGGLCIAQDPDDAEFPSMPRSLIHAGYADQVLAAAEAPALIQRFVRHPYLQADSKGQLRAVEALERHRRELHDIINCVHARTGHDFGSYKPPTVLRRIQRRMGLIGIDSLEAYLGYLKEHTREPETLANDLMINVTGFFRDPEAWEAFRMGVVRPMVEKRLVTQPLRAWVAACASGEEAYTLAMLIAEEAERIRKVFDVKIFATDTADKGLAIARAGVYPAGVEADFSTERLDRFFDKDDHTYRVKKELRQQVVFAPQDVLRDPPFSRVDIVTCRNLLIYLSPEAQRRALTLMHFALCDGGYLFLGNAETLGQAESLFEVVSKRWRIYRRTGAANHHFGDLSTLRAPELRALPGLHAAIPLAKPSSAVAIQVALLEEFGSPTAVVDANERLVYFHGDPEPFLLHPSGEPTHSLLDLIRAPLRPAVRSALRQAIGEKRPATIEQPLPDEAHGVMRITAAPLRANRAPAHFRVTFESPGTQPLPLAAARQSVPTVSDEALEQEVRALKRELQSSVEAFEATNEELKASHEEVTSINEELQSTNEELETGKEELQSLNEELTTVNTQLQTKLYELESLTSDLDNLLSSTDIAVVFLDTELNVRRFTPAIEDLLTLIPADIGRPVAHLAQKFSEDGDLIADAEQVLRHLTPKEAEVHSDSGRWYMRRTLPYRTDDRRVAGVVITFIDITMRKAAEEAIAAARARLQAAIEQMPAAVLMTESPTGILLLANRQAAALFNQPFPLPYVGRHWTETYAAFRGIHSDGSAYEVEESPLARSLTTGEAVLDEEIDFIRPDGARGALSMSTAPVRSGAGEVVAVIAAFWDITERKEAQAVLRQSEERFRVLVENARDYAIFMLDPQGRVASWNGGAERVTGFTAADILGQSGAVLFTPEDRAAGIPEREVEHAASTGAALDERWHMRKDGTRFWASGVMTAAGEGNLQGFVKIMRDQTERKETDSRLQEALQSAQQLRASAEHANRVKDEFISTVSHELRTPLNTIRLWSRMFISGKMHDQEVIKGGQMIDRAALAQQQLIDDLLDVSRMSTGHLRLNLRDTALVDTVKAAIEAVRPLAASRDLSLDVDLSADVGIVCVDPDRIQQVLWNVLANAVKFSKDGGRILVRMRRKNGTVEISIMDFGLGIRADFLPHVFDRFRQAQSGSNRRYGGLGLGLAIARQLVELHGGTMTAYSEGEGHGATFTLYLPLEKTRLAADHRDQSSEAIPESNGLHGVEVLLVEDETMSREATKRLLEQWGALVRSVQSARQAREAFIISRPGVIIADIGMPDEDGYSLLEGLRSLEQEEHTPRVPAIAVTAFARSEDRERALAAGFDDHVTKPVDPERLLQGLAKLVVPPAAGS